MAWYICIVVGFLFIGVGVASWFNSNVVEKVYDRIETNLVNEQGVIIQQSLSPDLFRKYRLVGKEK